MWEDKVQKESTALSKHISVGKYNIATVIKWGIWSYLPIFKQPTNQFIHELYHCMSALYPIIFSWWISHFHWDASHFFSHHLHIFHLGPPQDPWDPDLLILGRMPAPPEGHRESLTRDSRLDMRWIFKQKNIGSTGSIGVSYIKWMIYRIYRVFLYKMELPQ